MGDAEQSVNAIFAWSMSVFLPERLGSMSHTDAHVKRVRFSTVLQTAMPVLDTVQSLTRGVRTGTQRRKNRSKFVSGNQVRMT